MDDDLKVREILNQAADLPEEKRAAFLEQACGGDNALRAEVESLLTSLDEGEEFLADRPFSGSGAIDGRIGHYKLIEKIGEGGMGLVFLAQQERPVQREVALKIIKPGMDSQAVIARFQAERQALAMMDHSNIARVFDAGTTPAGRPYFVMELVRGIAITRYCDEKRLNPQQRLELFIPICQAIQHAHQKGIVHRDLKPSNILVAESDGKQLVKVIDFGIAKAIDQEKAERDAFTQTGMLLGTPEYMSPEQAGANSRETDTRSDIYSLGVILYELLTGVTPFDRAQLRQTGYEQIMRAIREVEPSRPSTRLSTFGEGVASASAMRRMEPRRLTRLLNGDLDVIVMKCLEKDRGRRYQTADGLAHDIECYLSNDPILATPPSMAYVLRKFYRKHRTAISITFAFTILLALCLITTSIVFWILKGQASHQRDVALTALGTAQKAQLAERVAREDANQKTTVAQEEAYVASMFAAADDISSGDFGQADYLLGLAPKGLRNWEWHYLHAECCTPILSRHFDIGLDWGQYNQDKSQIIEAMGTPVHYWVDYLDSSTFQTLRTIDLLPGGFRPFAVSPDQQRMIGEKKDRSLMVLDGDGHPLVPVALNQAAYVYTTLFTSDHSKFITTSPDGAVSLWDTNTGHLIRQFAGNTHEVIATRFNRQETQLVTGAMNGIAKVYDLESGNCISTFHEPAGDCVYSCFSPDGTRVSSSTFGTDRQATVWETATGKELFTLTGGVHNNVNSSAEYSSDGKMIGVAGGKFITLFDAQTGHELTVLRGPHGRTFSMSFSRDNLHVLAGSNDNTLRLWALDSPPRPLVFGGPSNPAVHSELSGDGATIAVHNADGATRIYDIDTGKLRVTVDAAALQKLSTDFHATGSFDPAAMHVATPFGGSIAISDSNTGAVFARLNTGVADSASTLTAFTHDGRRVITAAADHTIQIWDLATGQSTARFSIDDLKAISQLSINSTDDRLVVAGSDNRYRLCDLQAGKLIGELEPRGEIAWFTFTHDGRQIATGTFGRFINILDSSTGKRIGGFYSGHSDILSASYSPDDSTMLLCFLDEIVDVWDLKSSKRVQTLFGHDGAVLGACYSPDGTRIVTASRDHTVRIWDAKSCRELLTLRGHTAPITLATFSKDGTKILTQSEDGTARVWDAISFEEHATAKAGVSQSPEKPLH